MEEQGPFDRILQPEPSERRDRTAIIIVVTTVILGIFLLILVLPPISIFDDGEDSAVAGPVTAVMREEFPPPPSGFEAVSALFDLSTQGSALVPARLTINLSASVQEGEALALFAYQDGRWRRLGDAVALGGGDVAQGEVPFVPGNVAVLRPVGQARLVLGSLPPGAELDPQAAAVLTTLNPAGFSPSPGGGVSGDPVELPADLQTAVAPTLSASTPSEIDTLNAILASSELRTAHVNAILQFVRENDFAGVDLDYQSIDPARGDEFVTFVRDLSNGLRGEGRSLGLTLPLPVRDDGGWDTLGFDWQALAPLVDTIKLGSEPEPDRYFQRMEEALGFLVPRVGSGKLLLPLSRLSRERGVDGLRTLTLTEALTVASVPVAQPGGSVAPGGTVEAASQNLAGGPGATSLQWDDSARAVAFTYTGAGGARTIWLANVFSETFKLELAHRYQLGGVVIEDVSRRTADADSWPAIRQYATTGDVELVKPNGALLQPRWTASGGALETADGASVTWRAPDEIGTYTLTLIVSDGVLLVGQELQVPVQPRQGTAPP